jgi:hypothetical protein
MQERNHGHFGRLRAFSNLDQSMNAFLMNDRIVAIGLLTERDLTVLGPTFDRAWPVEEALDFNQLLRAIDEADRDLEENGRREQ